MSSSRRTRPFPRVIALATAAAVLATPALLASSPVAAAPAAESITITKSDYADRIAAMWMAECLANWTGLQVEHDRPNGPDKYSTKDPFYTDADWGTEVVNGRGQQITIDWDNPDPCGADDDTDIEYSYMHEMIESAKTVKLSPEDIAHTWNTHVDSFVWYSNSAADLLIKSGVRPPSTTLGAANQHRNIIDAQLTTELFGALAPGRPDVALDIAQLPVRTSAGGFATHAAQFNVLLYSLAPLVDKEASGYTQIRWLIDEARQYLPGDSRASEIIDWVTAQYDANPGENWEALRDRIYDRYQANSVANGFNFIVKYESAINLAAEVAGLLHGEGDLLRTIQIGALSGWDADNPAASNAGLIGLMSGTEKVESEFAAAGINIVERFNADRTRINMTDYLPEDPEATDTFDMMGERALVLVDEVVRAAGGSIGGDSWTIPLVAAPASTSYEALATVNPDVDLYVRSGNNTVLRAGGEIAVTSNLIGDASLYATDTSSWPAGRMFPVPVNGENLDVVADGFDQDTRGLEEWTRNPFFTGKTGGEDPVVEVVYSTPVTAESVRLIGGGVSSAGGWATGAEIQIRTSDGTWTDAPAEASSALNPAQPFQQTDLVFEGATELTGVRVTFTGTNGVLNLTEIDPMAAPRQQFTGFDVHAEAAVNITVNGSGATAPDARSEVVAGSQLTVRYEVVNTGDAPLHGISLRDGDGNAIAAVDALAAVAAPELLPGESWSNEVALTAIEGDIDIQASALARDGQAAPVRAEGAWYGVGVNDDNGTGPGEPTPGPSTTAGPGTGPDGGKTPGGSLATTGADFGLPLMIGGALLFAGLLAFATRLIKRRRAE